MTKPAEPKVRVVYKPLVRKGDAGGVGRADAGCTDAGREGLSPDQKLRSLRFDRDGASAGTPDGVNAAFLRAANEDDDGYDPYSDRQEVRPFFEENPWD